MNVGSVRSCRARKFALDIPQNREGMHYEE
jgi:hypothetical protein